MGSSLRSSDVPYCRRAVGLLRELKRAEWLPPYNSELVRQSVEEINALYQRFGDTLPGVRCTLACLPVP